jgi:transcription elongation factor GreA
LENPSQPSFAEALSQFVTVKKNGKKGMEGHQEIGRFIAWFGRERRVSELTPAQVADYAQHVGLGGSESTQKLSPVKGFLGFLKDEGWVETGLATHLRVPRSRRTTSGNASATAASATQLSKEGFERLQEQVKSLKGERVNVLEDIKRAMADKDFRENAPLDAAKERQAIIEGRIRELEASLASAEILSAKPRKKQMKVAMGTKVTLKDLGSGRKILYTLVDMREADVASGKISTQSPVGQALLERSVGEEVEVTVPKGTVRYKVERIGT